LTESASGAPALSIADLSKTFSGVRVLDHVSVEVHRGEIRALLGGNGSGKSTTIKILAGVVPGDRGGRVEVGSQRVPADRVQPEWARRAGLRFVHQDLALFPAFTVAENVALACGFRTAQFAKVDWRALHRRTDRIVEHMGLAIDPRTPVRMLRPGQRALLALGRALEDSGTTEQRVLVLDEPTTSLSRREAVPVLQTLRRVADGGAGILLVGHRIGEVLAIADTATVLRDGAVSGTLESEEFSVGRVAELMATSSPSQRGADTRRIRLGTVVLECDRLSGRRVRDVDLAVRRGEIVGVAGRSGSGRSELLRMLFGAARVRAGTIRLDGRAVQFRDIGAAMRAGLAYVPQDRDDGSFASMSVAENLSAASISSYWRRGRLQTRAEQRDARVSMARFAVRAVDALQPMRTLSGGNQQKVVFERWLRRKPRILLLDDPTSGVDVHARAEIESMIARAAAAGAAVLMVSSDLDELCEIADRVVALVDGRIVADLHRPELEPTALEYVTSGDGSGSWQR
jgi:ribose transport system ATP-binding protein